MKIMQIKYINLKKRYFQQVQQSKELTTGAAF